jgi:putative ABC transport system ATP-binding protein
MPVLVSLEEVTKRYQRGREMVEVLYRVNLTVQQGEFLALMGPSGSGKTTLLNLMGGLDRVDQGKITIGGQRIDELGAGTLADWRARHAGFIFQFYHLLDAMTAAKNVEMPLLLTNLSGKERAERVRIALDLVGLREEADRRPEELSGGQQQRVAIARAVVTDPSLLICDEPTGDLDRQNADQVLQLLRLLNERGKTIVLVTHDVLAARHASRVIEVNKGQITETQKQAAA